MFQLIQDVYEVAAGEAAEQYPPFVAVRNRERGAAVSTSLSMIRTGATHKPAGTVAAPTEGNSNLLGTHRDTAKASAATVLAKE